MTFRAAALVSLGAFLFGACTRSPSSAEAPISISPVAGGGPEQVFTAVFSDPQGVGHVKQARVLINQFADGRQACYVVYDRLENAFYLVNDTGLGSTRMMAGAASELSNSQCRLVGRGSSASASGKNVTLVLDLHFVPVFAGEKNVFLGSADASGEETPFRKAGDWRVNSCGHTDSAPSAVSVVPQSGGGWGQTFSLTYSSSRDASDLAEVRVLINRAADSRSACYLRYDPLTGLVRLADDSAQQFMSVPLKGGQTVANSQCSVNPAGSSMSTNGATLVSWHSSQRSQDERTSIWTLWLAAGVILASKRKVHGQSPI
jgi:hypothetical protein